MNSGHVFLLAALTAAVSASSASAQFPQRNAVISGAVQQGARVERHADGVVITPASGIRRPEDAGKRVRTHHKIFIPNKEPGPRPLAASRKGPPYSGYLYETPASLACVYGLVTFTKGCNPNSVLTNASGGSRAIAIVDAYHAYNVRADLNAYSAQFGLPPTNKSNFVIWYCGAETCNQTTPPARNEGWAQETTLDVQMAHALAPKAKIILVEARSDFYSDMYVAVRKAAQLVAAAGGGQVSMSWGSSEFSSQTTYAGGDKNFQTAKVVFFASSGDSPEPSWPSVSPWVVSVGGTSVVRNTSTGAFAREASWSSAGGGPSVYIQRPYYQPASAGPKRNSPDISAVANPSTGVWVRYLNSWYIFGGTSVSAPIAAAIVNNAGLFLANSPAELGAVYHGRGTTTNWYDVVTGTCGPNGKYPARSGYDYCGGIGAPRGRGGK